MHVTQIFLREMDLRAFEISSFSSIFLAFYGILELYAKVKVCLIYSLVIVEETLTIMKILF
jgi:hypothetical protein